MTHSEQPLSRHGRKSRKCGCRLNDIHMQAPMRARKIMRFGPGGIWQK